MLIESVSYVFNTNGQGRNHYRCVQVNSLALVWISHKHADHMLGLPAILAARHASSPPLQVRFLNIAIVVRLHVCFIL